MKCKFENCNNVNVKDYNFCILHLDLPHKNSKEFQEINELKNKEIIRKKEKNDFNFRGAKLSNVDFSNLHSESDLIFTGAYIENNVLIKDASIKGDIWFDKAVIGRDISLEGTRIDGNASLYGTRIKEHLLVDKAKINRYAWFEKAKIGGESSFNEVVIGSSLSFKEACIEGNTSFYDAEIAGDAWFDNAEIKGDVWFDYIEIKGGLSFKNTAFRRIKSQEKACRKAKTVWEKLGDREKSDYHFYREMESKRRQKPNYFKYPELIVQYPFGYGVYPERLLLSFTIALLTFAFLYWILGGILTPDALTEKLRFSFLSIIIPAYGVINAKTGFYGLLTIIEAFIGAFVWPTFIVTFARKYMR
ncbi:MAG: pentapeptide repeat-containing protein [Methanothermobacter sp.]